MHTTKRPEHSIDVINNSIRFAHEFLQSLGERCKGTIIAGGFVRDLHFGKSSYIKDIDIFCSSGKMAVTYSKIINTNRHMNNSEGIKLEPLGSEDCYYDSKTPVYKVYRVTIENLIPIEIISLDCDPVEYVDHWFDYDFCKCQMTKDYVTIYPEAIESWDKRYLSLNKNLDFESRDAGQLDRIHEHGQRIFNKYRPHFQAIELHS